MQSVLEIFFVQDVRELFVCHDTILWLRLPSVLVEHLHLYIYFKREGCILIAQDAGFRKWGGIGKLL